MTVAELIKKLKAMPPTMPVVCEFEACGDVSDIELLPSVEIAHSPDGLVYKRGPGFEAASSGHPGGCVVIRGIR